MKGALPQKDTLPDKELETDVSRLIIDHATMDYPNIIGEESRIYRRKKQK
jgi:hypothetical protein